MYIDRMFPDELDNMICGGGCESAAASNGGDNESMDVRNGGGGGAPAAGPAAVLPIGSVEQHGPHLLLGCDGFIASALAQMTAKKLGGALFPTVPFSWIGGLRPYAGTIDLRPFTTAEYLMQICLGILRMGFTRLVIVNCHGGGREMVFSVGRRLNKETGKPVVTMYPTNIYDSWPELYDVWRENGNEFDWGVVEASELVAALEYLNKNELAQKVIQNIADTVAEFGDGARVPEQPGLRSIYRMGEVGHDYNHECMHVMPTNKIEPKSAVKALDFMADKLAWGANNAK